jgi:hypothetical protein
VQFVNGSTALTLNPIANVPWGTKVTVTGKLTSTSTIPNFGIGGKTITFSGTGAGSISSVTTNPDGTFTAFGTAPGTVNTGLLLSVQAHFAGDSGFGFSDSTTRTYNTLKHGVSLAVAAASSSVPWGRPIQFIATFTDTDASKQNSPIGVKTISFTGSGVIPSPLTGTTDSLRQVTVTGTAPKTVNTGWTVQAHFAGDSFYKPADSQTQSYSTTKHTTSLTLSITPTSVLPGARYAVSGTLTDVSTSTPLGGGTITFTATAPITISPKVTDTMAHYSAAGLIAPHTPGTYNIQSHFATTSLYNAANSPMRTLTVSATAPQGPAASTQSLAPQVQQQHSPSSPSTTTAPSLSPGIQQQPQQAHVAVPIAKAGISKTVGENTIVMLDGRASYSPNSGSKIVAYQWIQLSMGVPVILTGANTATPTLTTPTVPSDTVLAFSLRVLDDHRAVSTNPAVVYVMVKHNPNNIGTTGGNIPRTTITQPQQQQPPIVPNNNEISPPSQQNSAPSTPPLQTRSPNTQNIGPSGVP